MIVLLHAYSRSNAGDGLLVDEALALLERAGVPAHEVHVVAADAESFADLNNVRPALARNSGASRYCQALGGLQLLAGLPHPTRQLVESADALVAVGGGYLRAGRAKEAITSLLAHGSQLRLAARSGKPTVYLPQSIGPLRGPVGFLFRRWLRRIDAVIARDDVTAQELAPSRNVHRVPDLGVLKVGQLAQSLPTVDPAGPVLLAARQLPEPRTYRPALSQFLTMSPDVECVVQSSVGGGNDDPCFYNEIGVIGPLARMSDRLPIASVVVSVRLHGAIQAMLAGVPAIHLSYERKGLAAFSDLGLERYVHSARDFDPQAVRTQVDQLKRDASPYWKSVWTAEEDLRKKGRLLEELVRRTVTRSS